MEKIFNSLKKLDETLDQHSQKFMRIDIILDEHSTKLDEHTIILNKHGTILDEHTTRHDKHDQLLHLLCHRVDKNTEKLSQIEAALHRLGLMFENLQREVRQGFEALHFIAEKVSGFDTLPATSKDHEERIVSLEHTVSKIHPTL